MGISPRQRVPKANCAPFGAPVVEATPALSREGWPRNAVELQRALAHAQALAQAQAQAQQKRDTIAGAFAAAHGAANVARPQNLGVEAISGGRKGRFRTMPPFAQGHPRKLIFRFLGVFLPILSQQPFKKVPS